jgi:hypothetical protein
MRLQARQPVPARTPRVIAVAAALSVVSAGTAAAQVDPGTAALVDAVLEAHGGEAAIRAVNGLRMEGNLVTSGQSRGTLNRAARLDGVLTSTIQYPNRREIRVYMNGRAWRGGSAETLEEVSGPLRTAMRAQGLRMLSARVLLEHRSRVERLHDIEGLNVLSISFPPDLTLQLFVDPETRRILHSLSLIPAGPTLLRFSSTYLDYRVVDGILVAFGEENTAQGQPTAVIQLSQVETNPMLGAARDTRVGRHPPEP